MADEARAKRAAALEEKKRRLEQLKARRAERSATAAAAGSGSATAAAAGSGAASTGGNLDEYIDGLLKSEAPAVAGAEAPKSAAAAAVAAAETSTMSEAARDGDEGGTAPSSPDKQDAGTSTEAAATTAAAAVSAPVRRVETFTMATQTEDDDFPPPLSDEEDDEDEAAEKAKREAEAAAADAAAAAASTDNEQEGEKGTQTLPLPKKLDPSSVSKTITSRPFVTFLNSASKKVEKVLGAPALAELLDDPAYDDDVADDDGVGGDGEVGGAEGDDAAAAGGGAKRARRSKGRGGRGVLLGATSADTLDATGIIKSCQTYSCPRWTDNRDITSITWSPHRREMLVASYQSSAAASASSVDAAVRAVSPTDTPSSSLIPQSSELRSDGLALVWNLALPDRPEHIFCCGSPILTTAFHPTETRLLIGGCHSGQVVVWDVRAGRLPVQRSVGPSGGGHAHPICSMEVVEAGVSSLGVLMSMDVTWNFWCTKP